MFYAVNDLLYCCGNVQQICVRSGNPHQGCDQEDFTIWASDVLPADTPRDKNSDTLQSRECKQLIYIYIWSSSLLA